MIRNLKMLGLAIVAVFAMSAMVASAASAQHVFSSELEKTTFTGTSEAGTKDKFTVFSALGTQTVECHGAFEGTASSATKEVATLTVKATYTGCTFLGGAASVDMNGCHYVFTGTTDANGDARVDITCPGTATTQTIAVTSSLCNMYIGAQTTTEGVHYTNITENSKSAVTVKATVTAKVAEKTGGFCFGVGNEGTYESTATVTGYKDDGSAHTVANQVNVKVTGGTVG